MKRKRLSQQARRAKQYAKRLARSKGQKQGVNHTLKSEPPWWAKSSAR